MKLGRALKRTLKVLAGLVVVLMLAAGSGLYWLYATAGGARFILDRVTAASNGALSVGSVAGSFGDELVLGDLRYRDAGQEAAIDRVSFRLDIRSLPARMLIVDDLRSSVVRYRRFAEPPPAAGPAPAFRLPVTIRVDRASLEGVSIARDDGDLELERIVLAGAAEGSNAYLQRFEVRVLGFFLSMQGGVSWDGGLGVDGLLSWSGEIGGEQWLGSAEVDGRWPRFTIEQEMLEPFAQTAAGEIVLAASPAFDLAVSWPGLGTVDVAGSYAADEAVLRASFAGTGLLPAAFVPAWPGQLDASGTLTASFADGYRVESDDLRVDARLGEHRLGLELAGAFDDSMTVELARLAARLGDNSVELGGTIGAALDLTVAADLADLSQIAALAARDELLRLNEHVALATNLSGRAVADLALRGPAAGLRANGSIELDASSYAGLPLELAIAFATPASAGDALVIERFAARLGATRLSGSGRLGSAVLGPPAGWRDADLPLELSLEASAGDLGELARLAERAEIRSLIGRELPLAGLVGSAGLSLAVDGSLARPDLSGTLSLSGLQYDRLALSESTLDFSAGLYTGGRSRALAAAAAEAWSARVSAAGITADGAWVGSIDQLEIDEPWLGAWTLMAPVGLTLGPGRVELANACLIHRDSGLCGSGQYGDGGVGLTLSARDFDLGVLSVLLPPTIALAGPISLDASLAMPDGVPVGSLEVDGGAVDVSIALSENDRMTTSLSSVAIQAELDDYALVVDAGIESGALGRADIALSTDDIRNEAAPISGRFDVLWPDLSALTLLSPEIGEVGGTLALAIEVAGTAVAPELSGNGTLSAGRIAVPEWGVLIERIEGEARSDEGRSLRYRGSGYIEDSEILITGVTELDPAANWPTRLTLTGENVPIARRPDATVIASPSFDVDIRLPRIDVNGSVFVPEASLSVEELPSQAVRVSPDSVVHGRVQAEELRPLAVTALVSVELGDEVRYTGSNLDTTLSGGLTVEYQSGRSPIAGGSVSLEGSYSAYGQTLELERGELLFAGPLDDPAIDVLATRSVGTTTVGVRVTGRLQSPATSMFSDPAMSEANALSYLMFGRPLRSADDEETSTLEAAAFALGVQQALPAVQRVGESLGLDELSIESTEIDAGSLMAGKYLSPKIYLSYTYGLFNRLGGFLLRYDINDRFSLETRSGDEKAMDLLYSIEKD